MKKIAKLGLLISAFTMASCSLNDAAGEVTNTHKEVPVVKPESTPVIESGVEYKVSKDDIKIGLICLHDNSSTYDKNFIESMYRALDNLGIDRNQLSLSTQIPEGSECYDEAARLAANCNVIFADSFGHEDYLIQAADEYKNVNFCHATGTKAHSVDYNNFSNAFASIYEGRYLAGIVAGYKLNEMIAKGDFTADQAKIGYVGAWSFAEVISGFTSFYLGAKSVCPSVTMDVKFTGSWFNYDLEYQYAKNLIEGGCKLISGHADSYGAPTACEEENVPNVSYNGATNGQCPNTYLVSSMIDWTPYFEYMIIQTMKGEKILNDYVGDLNTGSVKLAEYGTGVSQAAKDAVATAEAAIKAGTLNIFDTSKFTVGGETLTTYLADVDTDPAYTGDTEVVFDGVFHESAYRSGPYFDVKIDGITWLNAAY